jgi:superfamily II DNA helicase RecQ
MLAMGRSVVMVVPTGEGKMTVPLLAAHMLRQTRQLPGGVVVITQPLTRLMLEQLKNPVCKAAVLTMKGEVMVAEGETAQLVGSQEGLFKGEYQVLIGHPESFGTAEGQRILTELHRRELITAVVIDEVHTNIQWTFRELLMRETCMLLAFARDDAPVCLMTATATKQEIDKVVGSLGLQTDPVLLACNPVHDHIKISILRRPPNAHKLCGVEASSGAAKPGLWDLLYEIYFKHYFADKAAGRKPKKCLIFFRGMRQMVAVHSHLRRLTGQCSAKTADFVMVHSDLTPPTERVIVSRMKEITIFLATTRMLLGLDLAEMDMVIFAQPFDDVAALLQGGGRGGRKRVGGTRSTVQLYQLHNGEDLTKRNKKMTIEMRSLCRAGETACPRDTLRRRYAMGQVVEELGERGETCCHHHDLVFMFEESH